jgi:hypothetical protein
VGKTRFERFYLMIDLRKSNRKNQWSETSAGKENWAQKLSLYLFNLILG